MTTKKRQKLRRMTFQNEHRTNYNSGDKYYKELREQTNDKIRTTIQRGSLRPKYI